MLLNENASSSLFDGGVTHWVFRTLGRCEVPQQLFRRTAVGAALVAWLPLLILSVVEGVAWGDRVTIPLLYDIGAYTRFFIAVPMLVLAEAVIGPKLSQVAEYFVSSGRIAEKDCPAYRDAVAELVRLRDAKWTEGIVVVIAYVGTAASLVNFVPAVSNWRWVNSAAGIEYTLAAWWYALVSIPIFQFLLYRWFLRMIIWTRFLYSVSRLDLNLMATHPDRAGGLGFIGQNQRFFAIITFALGAVFAGVYANEILYDGRTLNSIRIPVGLCAVLLAFLIQAPSLFFFFKLRKTKRKAVFVYGTLALQYTSAFHEKWIDGKHAADEQLMGSSDIQSLADMGSSYQVIREMNLVPFTIRSSLWPAVTFLLPMLPLTLTVMPVGDILKTLLKLLM